MRKKNIIKLNQKQLKNVIVESIGKMFNINETSGQENRNYRTYHRSYTSAVQEAKNWLIRNNIEFDEEEFAMEFGINNSRPKMGKTTRISLPIYKIRGKNTRKTFHVQIYAMDISSFELNMYIN